MTAPFRYKKLGYVAVAATDPDATADFVESVLGLDRGGTSPEGEIFFRCGPDHHSILIQKGEAGGTHRVGWELEDGANLDSAFEHFKAIGLNPKPVEEAEAKRLGLGRAFRVREPHSGAEFEYYDRMKQHIRPFSKKLADIQRLGHVVLQVPDLKRAVDYVTREMNFRISDHVGEFVTLMRCWPNPFHHSFAFGQSETGKPGHHHINFMVTSVDDVGRLFWRARKAKAKIVFGPGRHPPSDSVCLYILGPDNLMWEYSYGMEEFPETGAREPRLMSTEPEDMDFWGAVPEPEFMSPAGVVVQGRG